MTQVSTETIKKRRSVRTYEKRSISETDLKNIYDYLAEESHLIGPFGTKVDVDVVPVMNNITDKGLKVGTYGFIKNPQAYIVGSVENTNSKLIEYGYVFEKLVLYATNLGIGTCWLGGTFSRNSFEKEVDVKEGRIIPCITPIGYPLEKQRFLEKAMRTAVKADNKKKWNELFFYQSFNTPLLPDDAKKLELPIEMVRIGPSASNKQPWRLVVSEDNRFVHFYLAHTPNYSGNKLGFQMQRIDIGIAMCHFEIGCLEQEIFGSWKTIDPKLELPNEHTEYIITWEISET